MSEKFIKVLEMQKEVVTNTFSRKLQQTTKEWDLENFKTTSRFLIPYRITNNFYF